MKLPQIIHSSVLMASLLCSPAVFSATEQKTLDIVHAQGTTTVPYQPQKVVVLSPAALDITDALGIKVVGVPQTSAHYPGYLQQYQNADYFNAGTLFEPNFEALNNAQPDLIIAGARAREAYNKLSDIAPTISPDLDPQHFVQSLHERTEQLGEIFGKQAQAKQLLADFDAQIADVRQLSTQAGSALMLMVNGGKISAYSPGSRFGFIYDVLGFKPATTFATTGSHGNAVSAEFIMEANPDWLFVVDRDNAIGRQDGTSAQQVLDNPLVRRTNAWKKQHIIYLDSSALYISGGIQSYSRFMNQVKQKLNQAHDPS